jgi:hypothetical protein
MNADTISQLTAKHGGGLYNIDTGPVKYNTNRREARSNARHRRNQTHLHHPQNKLININNLFAVNSSSKYQAQARTFGSKLKHMDVHTHNLPTKDARSIVPDHYQSSHNFN